MTTANNVAAQAGDEPMRCPFCGSGAHVFGAYNAFAVNCTGCNAYGPSMDRQGAIDGWNKRYVATGALTDEGTQFSPRATTAVTEALQVCVKALEFRKERSANDEFALNLARIALAEVPRATADVERDAALYRALHTPEISQFIAGVEREALFQRDKWGADHDAGKAPEDWFWLLGYLGGKALHAAKAGNTDKALHHTISSAAALLNWHAAILGAHTAMRPGIATTKPGA